MIAGKSAPGLSRLKDILEFAGHQVAEADNTRQTVQNAAGGTHDLLIVDSGIESVSGYELCRAIRPVSDLGIILLIPDSDRQTRIDALEAGGTTTLLRRSCRRNCSHACGLFCGESLPLVRADPS